MDTTRLALQMIAIQRAIFDNSYMSMTVMQDYTQNMMEGYLRYFPWLTQANKKPLMASFEQIKQARAAYKQSVDQGFAQLEEMLYHKKPPASPVPTEPVAGKAEPAAAAPETKADPASAPAQQPKPTPPAESAPAPTTAPKKAAAPRKRATPAKKPAAKTTTSATKKAAPKRTAAKKTTPATRRTTKTAAPKTGDETAS